MRNLVQLFLQGWFLLCLLVHLAMCTKLLPVQGSIPLITCLGFVTIAGNYLPLWMNGELKKVQNMSSLMARMGTWRIPYLGLCGYVVFRFVQMLMITPLKSHGSTPDGDLAAVIFITSSIMTIAGSSLGLLRPPARG